MWVSKRIYQEMRDDLVAAKAVRDTLTTQCKALEVTNDWFRVRIGQLEHERAVLIAKYMGVEMPVPVIERVRDEKKDDVYNVTPHFNDVGDEMARKMGIEWNPDGSVAWTLPTMAGTT